MSMEIGARQLRKNTRNGISVSVPTTASTTPPEHTMNSSIKDQIKGTLHEAKGKAKQIAGKVADDAKLEAKGSAEKNAGKVQRKVGEVKKVLGL
jgi:uncharacterized protein YjbJ (UPF0337 family)